MQIKSFAEQERKLISAYNNGTLVPMDPNQCIVSVLLGHSSWRYMRMFRTIYDNNRRELDWKTKEYWLKDRHIQKVVNMSGVLVGYYGHEYIENIVKLGQYSSNDMVQLEEIFLETYMSAYHDTRRREQALHRALKASLALLAEIHQSHGEDVQWRTIVRQRKHHTIMRTPHFVVISVHNLH
jgi:hypothetical protein